MTTLLNDQKSIQDTISQLNIGINGHNIAEQNTTINVARERLNLNEPPAADGDVGNPLGTMARNVTAVGRAARVVPTNEQNRQTQANANANRAFAMRIPPPAEAPE